MVQAGFCNMAIAQIIKYEGDAIKSSNEYLEEKAQTLGLKIWNKSEAKREMSDASANSPKDLVFILDEIRTTETCFRLDVEQKLTPCVQP